MKVSEILKSKSGDVTTTSQGASLRTVAMKMKLENIGALVVSDDGRQVLGLVSERHITRALAEHGSGLLDLSAADVMSKGVPTCSPDDTLRNVMAVMTKGRQRHLPVVDQGRLCGIISIGDVVKYRLEEMEVEANVLHDVSIAKY